MWLETSKVCKILINNTAPEITILKHLTTKYPFKPIPGRACISTAWKETDQNRDPCKLICQGWMDQLARASAAV